MRAEEHGRQRTRGRLHSAPVVVRRAELRLVVVVAKLLELVQVAAIASAARGVGHARKHSLVAELRRDKEVA
jgi:hypothetical protein